MKSVFTDVSKMNDYINFKSQKEINVLMDKYPKRSFSLFMKVALNTLRRTGMSKKKISLACSVCGSRNYTIVENLSRTERLEVKKFCKYCGKHTLHRETK